MEKKKTFKIVFLFLLHFMFMHHASRIDRKVNFLLRSELQIDSLKNIDF